MTRGGAEEDLLLDGPPQPRGGDGRRRIFAFAAGVSLGLLCVFGAALVLAGGGNGEIENHARRGFQEGGVLGFLGGERGGGGGGGGGGEGGGGVFHRLVGRGSSSSSSSSFSLASLGEAVAAHNNNHRGGGGVGVAAAAAAARKPQLLPAMGAAPKVDPLLTFNTPRCRQTRAALAKATNHDGDVVVIHELKAVYVDIVKAASEAIRSTLEDRFHASWSADVGQYAHPVRGRPTRSSTSYLTKDVIANYTFFTFVRDPNTRFRSSYEQAMCRERCTLCTVRGKRMMYTPTIPEVTAFLTGRLAQFYRDLTLNRGSRADVISLQEAWVDEHFESQLLRLSGATADGTPVPINFIGRVENFDHDWAALMDHLGVGEGDERRASPAKREHACDIPARGEIVRRQRATPVTTQEKVAVSSLYQDDFECLGYPKPNV